MDVNNPTPLTHTVAIIGLGPKGFYCLERLLAECQATPLRHPLHIHVFNRTANFGASPIYDPDQPEYILVNISVGEIDLWTSEEPPSTVNQGKNFIQWYQDHISPDEPLTGDEFLSRAVVGRYLVNGFRQLLENLPERVTVFCNVGEVTDIQSQNNHYLLHFSPNNHQREIFIVDKILLATGHSRLRADNQDNFYQPFTCQHSETSLIPFAYPVTEMMKPIPSKAIVAMRGIGLTFIDAVLELTEGRGGRFERTTNQDLVYRASGLEPEKIYPFSRSGLPMTPKACDLPPNLRPLKFFTNEALKKLKGESPDGKIDFETHIWPLFELEMEHCYYQSSMKANGKQHWMKEIGNDIENLHKVIARYLAQHPECESFDYQSVLDPVIGRSFESGSQFSLFIEQYLEQEIIRARQGHAGSAVKAAIDLWYEARKELGAFLQFGGLTPDSHQKLIEFYFPRLKRVVFGPPIINIEKILALQKAGLLDYSVARNPKVISDEGSKRFKLRNAETKTEILAEVLVDARYPATRISEDASLLYRNLYGRGVIREFENRQDQRFYRPGAIDTTDDLRFILDVNGIPNKDISVIGIPTEGNLVGNLTMGRDKFAGVWAKEIIKQFQNRDSFLDNCN